MKTNSKPAALRLDRHITAHGAGLSYRRLLVRQRTVLFAAPPVDLLTLVIAEAIKRKAQAEAQAEIQRDELRDTMFEMPVAPERGQDRGMDTYPADPDDYV
jgi:hypothetical protein